MRANEKKITQLDVLVVMDLINEWNELKRLEAYEIINNENGELDRLKKFVSVVDQVTSKINETE